MDVKRDFACFNCGAKLTVHGSGVVTTVEVFAQLVFGAIAIGGLSSGHVAGYVVAGLAVAGWLLFMAKVSREVLTVHFADPQAE